MTTQPELPLPWECRIRAACERLKRLSEAFGRKSITEMTRREFAALREAEGEVRELVREVGE